MNRGSRFRQSDFISAGKAFHIHKHRRIKETTLHWHDCCELELVLAGSGQNTLNGTSHPLQRGTMYFMRPSDFHDMQAQTPVTLYTVMFTEEQIPSSLQPMMREKPLLCQLSDADFRFVCSLLTQLELLSADAEGFGNEQLCKNILESIFIILLRYVPSARPQKTAENDHIRKALLYIHTRFRENIDLDSVAAQVGLNKSYFSELFHRETGVTFKAYLNELRAEHAKNLLSRSELPITEVAYASGFNSLSNFIRIFHQKFGCSPSQLRETLSL